MADRAHGGHNGVELDFSVNLNPLITVRELKRIITPLIESVIPYPETRAQSLVRRVSQYLGADEKRIIAGNGSIELMYCLPRILDIKRIITLEPTFCEYRYLAEINNLNHLPLFSQSCFFWDFVEIKKKLTEKDLIIICNPNNPTGNLFLKDEIIKLCETRAYILVDEAFMDFSERDESVIGYLKDFPNLFVLKSFTKIFSLAGLRIGFLLGDEKTISQVDRILPLWNVNALALEVTKSLIDDNEIIEKTKRYIKHERDFLIKKLKKFPIEIFESVANFLLLRFENARGFSSFSKSRGLAVRTPDGFLGLNSSYLRIAVKKRRENIMLIKLFEEFFRNI